MPEFWEKRVLRNGNRYRTVRSLDRKIFLLEQRYQYSDGYRTSTVTVLYGTALSVSVSVTEFGQPFGSGDRVSQVVSRAVRHQRLLCCDLNN
jgi:hypothetical protein